jgi:hypothetical protein
MLVVIEFRLRYTCLRCTVAPVVLEDAVHVQGFCAVVHIDICIKQCCSGAVWPQLWHGVLHANHLCPAQVSLSVDVLHVVLCNV